MLGPNRGGDAVHDLDNPPGAPRAPCGSVLFQDESRLGHSVPGREVESEVFLVLVDAQSDRHPDQLQQDEGNNSGERHGEEHRLGTSRLDAVRQLKKNSFEFSFPYTLTLIPKITQT